MAGLTSILREVRGEFSDRARDRLPDGMVYRMTDYIPTILQGGVRMRGLWSYLTTALPDPIGGMFYAPFFGGGRLIVISGTSIYAVNPDTLAVVNVATGKSVVQNPVFHRDRVIIPDSTQGSVPVYVAFNGVSYTVGNFPASSQRAKFATVWKDRVVLGNDTDPTRVAFSKPGDPLVAWDSLSLVKTSLPISGLASMRTQVLCLHNSSVERLRGNIPPDSTLTDPTGDLILDELFDRSGCWDARSITYWNDNVLFCDSSGITLTDGASVRNLVLQSGELNRWRAAWERGGNLPLTAAAFVHQDNYVVTLRHPGFEPLTYVCDLNARRMYALSNIDAGCYAFSSGTTERILGTQHADQRVTELTSVFEPDDTVMQVDGNGQSVLPTIETAWSQLSKSQAFKRIHDTHVTYEAHRDDTVPALNVEYVKRPTDGNTQLGTLPASSKYVRRKIGRVGRAAGVAFKITQLVPTRDTRIYEVAVRAEEEEEHKL
jgi:hypothetical protein